MPQVVRSAPEGLGGGGIPCPYAPHTSEPSRFINSFLEDSPVYSIARVDDLAAAATRAVGAGANSALVEGVLRGGYKPSRKLLAYVADAIGGHEPWHLLDEQQVVYNRIMGDIAEARRLDEKRAIIVTGAPGTGKSVIAVQVVGAAARNGYGVVHATGSKAFTTNLRGIVGRRETFSYFNNFQKVRADGIELIVCDEAHRIRETSSTRFQKGDGRLQVDELLSAGRVTAFILDQRQSVRANEIGSVHLIEERARALGIPVLLYDLNAQFRCAGSESYIKWVDHMLGLSPNRSMAWKTGGEYDLRVVDDLYELEAMLAQKMAQGSSARMVAGCCWEWSDPHTDGTLVEDVVVGSWSKPWNRKPRDMWRNKGSAETAARHPYTVWATQDEGFGQVGCIYFAQGFEFDYVGLIWGGDLRWDRVTNRSVADLRQSKDVGFRMGLGREGAAVEKLRQIYRVLATWGMKGTYIYCVDDSTRDYIDRMGGGLL